MAGSCMVAMESRKHAARRPSPPLPRPASGSCSSRSSQSRLFFSTTCFGQRIEQEVGDVVGQRAADEKLHREVVDALGVLALVGLLREHPALREDIPHGAGGASKRSPAVPPRRVDDVVEQQMAFVERVGGARELDRAAAVLLEELRDRIDGPSRLEAASLAMLAHFRGPPLSEVCRPCESSRV